jgi:hypothetical protein
MWSGGLILWIYPSLNREIRYWSGIATLFYLLLIFLVFSTRVETPPLRPDAIAPQSLWVFVFPVVIAVSLIASVWLLGPISGRCRRSCYIVLTISNALFCLLMQQPEVAILLVIVTGIMGKRLIHAWPAKEAESVRERLTEFLQFTESATPPPHPTRWGEFLLIGIVTFGMAIALLGPVFETSTLETNLITSRHRRTFSPVPARIKQLLDRKNPSAQRISMTEQLLSLRPDLVAMMAVVIFLHLAMSTSHSPRVIEAVPDAPLPLNQITEEKS